MTPDKKDAWAVIGRRIKEEREKRGLTQRALADAADITDKFVSNIERGSRQPATKTLQAIAGALKIELKDLFAGVPSTHKPLDADLATLASILRDASPTDRARAIDIVRSLVKPRKIRK